MYKSIKTLYKRFKKYMYIAGFRSLYSSLSFYIRIAFTSLSKTSCLLSSVELNKKLT